MPITIDEVSAEVAPPPASQPSAPASPAAAQVPLEERLERTLRLLAERRERVSDR
jgi:hypothetical protein